MPRVPRFESFPIEPAAILNDPAFLVMSPAAQRAYLKLFLGLWDQKEPGVIPDSDYALAHVARLGLEEWRAVRDEVAPALDTKSRPGFWISPKMVETYAAQNRWYERKKSAGRVGGNRRAANKLASTRQAHLSAHDKQNPTGGGRGEGGGGSKTESEQAPRTLGGVVPESDLGALASVPRARDARPRARSPRRVVPITPEHVQQAAKRFSLPIETVRLIAERITLEANDRGYRVLPSALLSWCRRESESPRPKQARDPGMSAAQMLAVADRLREEDGS